MRRLANFILLAALFAFGFTMILSRMSGNEFIRINNTLRQDTYEIDFVRISESKERAAFDTVLQAAKENKLNLYRYSQTDAQHITLYLDLNYRTNEIASALYTTSKLEAPNPKSFISSTNAYRLKPIDNLFSEVGYVENLMVQGNPSAIQKLQTALSPYYSQPIQPVGLANDNPALVLVQLAVSILVFSLIVSLFLVNFYRNYRELNVKLLQGYSKFNLLLQIIIENYLLPVLGVSLILVIFTFIYSNLVAVFLWTYLLTILGILFSFGVTLLALKNYKVSPEILNGRGPQKSVSRINRVLSIFSSIVIALAFIFFGNMITHLAGQVAGESQVNKALSNYSASLLIHMNIEAQSQPAKVAQYNLQETNWFIPQLQNKAILRLANGTEAKRFIQHEMMISSGYLDHFPIYDNTGKKVEVKNNETSLVELVPIGLKNQIDEIRTQVTQNHKGINFIAYEQDTGKKVSQPVNVKIIYIQPSRSPFDLSDANNQTIYRVLTPSNISSYSIYADLLIGNTSSGGLYLKKVNPVGNGYNNDPDRLLGLSLGESADKVYRASVDFQLRSLSPFIIALSTSFIIYLFSFFFGFSQFRKLGKSEMRTKVLLGAQKRNLHLPYLIYHFVFSFVLMGLGMAISNSYLVTLAALLLGLMLAIFVWSGRREKKFYDN